MCMHNRYHNGLKPIKAVLWNFRSTVSVEVMELVRQISNGAMWTYRRLVDKQSGF